MAVSFQCMTKSTTNKKKNPKKNKNKINLQVDCNTFLRYWSHTVLCPAISFFWKSLGMEGGGSDRK